MSKAEFCVYKAHVINMHNIETCPTTLSATLTDLYCIRHDSEDESELGLVIESYSNLLSASNHLMWIKVMNSIAALFTGGKMHERKAKALSQK